MGTEESGHHQASFRKLHPIQSKELHRHKQRRQPEEPCHHRADDCQTADATALPDALSGPAGGERLPAYADDVRWGSDALELQRALRRHGE